MKRVLLTSLVLIAVVASPAGASRIEFGAFWNDSRISGADVCMFAGGEPPDPIQMHVKSNDVRCFPADQIIEVPPGTWNFYLRHAEAGLIDPHPGFIVQRQPANASFRRVRHDLVPAATLDFADARRKLRSGEFLLVYLNNELFDKSPSVIRPLAAEASTMLVPSGTTVLPLMATANGIVGIGSAYVLEPGESRKVPPFERQSEGVHLVATLRFDHAGLSLPDVAVEPPVITLEREKMDARRPLIPIRGKGLFRQSLVVFKNLPLGDYSLKVAGDAWRHGRTEVKVPAAQTVVTVTSVPVEPMAAVRAVFDPVSVEEMAAERCDGAEGTHTVTGIGYKCDALSAEGDLDGVEVEGCTETTRTTGTILEGSVLFQFEVAGRYRAALKAGTRQYGTAWVSAEMGRVSTVKVEAGLLRVRGRLTKGGIPLQAELYFTSGSAMSDAETGYYTLNLGSPQRRRTSVVIIPCDGSAEYTHITREKLVPGSNYDIDVPDNELALEVIDKESRDPVAGVEIYLHAGFPDQTGYAYVEAVGQTDGSGKFRTSRRDPQATYKLCARKNGYEYLCEEDLRLADGEHRLVRMSLERSDGVRGQLMEVSPQRGHVFVVGASGLVSQTVVTEPDGKFMLNSRPSPDDYFVVTAMNVPLAIAEASWDGDALELSLPSGPATSFTVKIDASFPQSGGLVTLRLGERLVPLSAFGRHQRPRGRATGIQNRQPLLVTDVMSNGLVTVVLGPSPAELPPSISPDNLFALPQYRQLPAVQVVGQQATFVAAP